MSFSSFKIGKSTIEAGKSAHKQNQKGVSSGESLQVLRFQAPQQDESRLAGETIFSLSKDEGVEVLDDPNRLPAHLRNRVVIPCLNPLPPPSEYASKDEDSADFLQEGEAENSDSSDLHSKSELHSEWGYGLIFPKKGSLRVGEGAHKAEESNKGSLSFQADVGSADVAPKTLSGRGLKSPELPPPISISMCTADNPENSQLLEAQRKSHGKQREASCSDAQGSTPEIVDLITPKAISLGSLITPKATPLTHPPDSADGLNNEDVANLLKADAISGEHTLGSFDRRKSVIIPLLTARSRGLHKHEHHNDEGRERQDSSLGRHHGIIQGDEDSDGEADSTRTQKDRSFYGKKKEELQSNGDESLTKPSLKKELESLPDMSYSGYDAVPVEDYGLAMLLGMGYDPDKHTVKPLVLKKRVYERGGLGADAEMEKNIKEIKRGSRESSKLPAVGGVRALPKAPIEPATAASAASKRGSQEAPKMRHEAQREEGFARREVVDKGDEEVEGYRHRGGYSQRQDGQKLAADVRSGRGFAYNASLRIERNKEVGGFDERLSSPKTSSSIGRGAKVRTRHPTEGWVEGGSSRKLPPSSSSSIQSDKSSSSLQYLYEKPPSARSSSRDGSGRERNGSSRNTVVKRREGEWREERGGGRGEFNEERGGKRDELRVERTGEGYEMRGKSSSKPKRSPHERQASTLNEDSHTTDPRTDRKEHFFSSPKQSITSTHLHPQCTYTDSWAMKGLFVKITSPEHPFYRYKGVVVDICKGGESLYEEEKFPKRSSHTQNALASPKRIICLVDVSVSPKKLREASQLHAWRKKMKRLTSERLEPLEDEKIVKVDEDSLETVVSEGANEVRIVSSLECAEKGAVVRLVSLDKEKNRVYVNLKGAQLKIDLDDVCEFVESF